MRTKHGKGRYLAMMLVVSLVLTLFVSQASVLAANDVETDQICSLTVTMPTDSESSTQYEQLINNGVNIKLYRIGAINEDGSMAPGSAYASAIGNLFDTDSEATAEELANAAASAAETAKNDTPVAEAMIPAEGYTFSGLPTGLYLVVPETLLLDNVEYTFSPSVISLPTTTAVLDDQGTPNADGLVKLQYDASIAIKAECENLYGYLTITKTLDSFGENLGNATFLFDVTGTYTNNDGEEVTFSNVYSLTFDSAGSKSTEPLGPIPAGMEVTVTETYMSPSYSPVSATVQTVKIVSDKAVAAGDAEANVSFENAYNGGLIGGVYIENNFAENGENDNNYTFHTVTGKG